MGMFSTLAKAGVAKKLVSEARKPANQQKIRAAASKIGSRRRRTTAV